MLANYARIFLVKKPYVCGVCWGWSWRRKGNVTKRLQKKSCFFLKSVISYLEGAIFVPCSTKNCFKTNKEVKK